MLDWIRIDELRDEVGQDDFGDIVGVFFEEAQEALENLRRADTVVTLLGQLHFLQGSALNLGFSNFIRCLACLLNLFFCQKPPSFPSAFSALSGRT